MKYKENGVEYNIIELGNDYTEYVKYQCHGFTYTANIKDLSPGFKKFIIKNTAKIHKI